MRYSSLDDLCRHGTAVLSKGPVALIFAEDMAELASTVRHHARLAFREIVLFHPPAITLPDGIGELAHGVEYDTHTPGAVQTAINAVLAAAKPGIWLYWGYNAEYLFYPFCEDRSIGELLAFHTEERRDAMLTYVIDLYAADLEAHPEAVSVEGAMFDRAGYYALARPDAKGHPKERQLDIFGGLRRRFEEHVPANRSRIDRISLLRSKPGLKMRPDLTFNDEECNTYACPWHHNLTAAAMSFRGAKALKTNPGSTYDIPSFVWQNSIPFQWHSRQLLDLGMIEPGQWF